MFWRIGLRVIAGAVTGIALIVLAGVAMWVVSWHFDEGVTWADGILLGLYGAAMVGLLMGFFLPRVGGIVTLVAVGLHALGMMILFSAPFASGIYSWFLVPSALNLLVGPVAGRPSAVSVSEPLSRGVAMLVSAAALVVILQDAFFGSVPFHSRHTPHNIMLMILYGMAVVGLVVGLWRPWVGGVITLVAYLLYEAGLWVGGITGYMWTLLYVFSVPAILNLIVMRPSLHRGERGAAQPAQDG